MTTLSNMMLRNPVERWKSKINKNSAEYKKNYDEMSQLVGKMPVVIILIG